uniref:G-protein coupled receptors family 1 profile domain-containing protein n=1 Tax=Ditylenchus dipsaci TaxID=166011 RepID=A0A915CND6_9BILA
MAPAVDDTSVTSSVYVAGGSGSIKRRKEAPNNNVFANLELNKSAIPDTYEGVVDTATPQSPVNTSLAMGQQRNGGISPRFRTRASDKEANESKDCSSPLLRTYKVLIEYKGEDGKRPSVRLSSCGDSNAAFAVTKITSSSPDKQEEVQQQQVPLKKRHSAADAEKSSNGEVLTGARNSSSMNLKEAAANANRNEGLKKLPATVNTALVNQNGKSKALGSIVVGAASLKEEHLRKSEKERRKNERKQEGKAAKTLSAILIAFIVTWTPYNVIVCWEAFFPNSIPDVLFTISYCLCYVNSTINPLCYALCNARFRMTYMRILRCKNWKSQRMLCSYFTLLVMSEIVSIVASTTGDVENCEFSLQRIPGLSPLVRTDKNGKSCRGDIQLPFCLGMCKTVESGVHTFPYREQEGYVCAILDDDDYQNITLTDCDDGVDPRMRYLTISKATTCGCKKLPI